MTPTSSTGMGTSASSPSACRDSSTRLPTVRASTIGRGAALLLATCLAVLPAAAGQPPPPAEPASDDADTGKQAAPERADTPGLPPEGERSASEQPDQDQSRKQECVLAFGESQRSRSDGKLLAARRLFVTCAREHCPEVTKRPCRKWLQEIEALVPSIIVQAKAGTGEDVVDVRVLLGDKVVKERLDGRPLELDPGTYTLRLEHPPDHPVEQRLLVVQGQRNRLVQVQLGTTPGGEPTQPSSTALDADEVDEAGVSPLVWLGLGVAGVGVIVGAITGGVASSNYSELEEQCANEGCTQDEIDAGELPAHISTASFVVAGVGAVVGVVSLLVGGEGGDDDVAVTGSTLRVGIGSGTVLLEGTF